MAKGSGRRRITPADGLQYDPDTDMTNIEKRGASHTQSAKKELRLGIRTGARPTTESWYGNQGRRRGGVGRKDDNRNWKTGSKGKQYEKNLATREAQKDHRPVPDKVAQRSREKSINSDLRRKLPCVTWSRNSRAVTLRDWVKQTDKFLLKHGGESYRGYAAAQAKPYQYPAYSGYSRPYVQPKPPVVKIGFAKFEENVAQILEYKDLGIIYYPR